MRRKRAAVLALAMLVAGCAGPPPGTDGDLGNEWPAMAAPIGWEPKAGGCLEVIAETLRHHLYKPKDCQASHLYEIVHIGQAAEAPAPPKRESESYRKAWAECDVKTSELLGGPWRERKLRITLALPSPQSWESGARWVVCAAHGVNRTNSETATEATGSLKGRFADPELTFGCFQVADGGDYTVKSCTEPHNAEFAGLVNWDGSWESMRAERDKLRGKDHQLCQRVIGTFVGVSDNRSGTWIWTPTQEDWKVGDRVLRCYLWLEDISVSASMKGVGAKGWPVK